MRIAGVANPQGLWGETAAPDGQLIANYVNNSGGVLTVGDVVVATDVAGILATTTTTASSPHVIGVVAEPYGGALGAAGSGLTYASGTIVPVIIKGPGRINIGGNTVAAGANLSTSATAKVAAVAADAASVAALQALVGTFIAIARESQAAKDAGNTIRAYINKM